MNAYQIGILENNMFLVLLCMLAWCFNDSSADGTQQNVMFEHKSTALEVEIF